MKTRTDRRTMNNILFDFFLAIVTSVVIVQKATRQIVLHFASPYT